MRKAFVGLTLLVLFCLATAALAANPVPTPAAAPTAASAPASALPDFLQTTVQPVSTPAAVGPAFLFGYCTWDCALCSSNADCPKHGTTPNFCKPICE
jgi:hypothetical protein